MKPFATLCILYLGLSFNLYSQPFDFSDTDFRKADSVAHVYTGYSLENLKELSEKLTRPFQDEVEKFRAIYSWVCNNIESDYPYYLLNEEQREKYRDKPDRLRAWNKTFSKQVYAKLLRENKTVCTGYAYLIRELSYWAGLTSVIVDGYGRSANSNVGGEGIPNHSWNTISLNGQWYLCDATWSSGSINPISGLFVKKYDAAYFLASPALFIRNHYPIDTSMMLLRDKISLKEFLAGPVIYKGTYKYQVNPIFPATLRYTTGQHKRVFFRFTKGGGLEFSKVELEVNGRRIVKRADVNQKNEYSIDHIFKHRGNYVVHLVLDSDYAFTYRIKVN